jgi:hypothetical protein
MSKKRCPETTIQPLRGVYDECWVSECNHAVDRRKEQRTEGGNFNMVYDKEEGPGEAPVKPAHAHRRERGVEGSRPCCLAWFGLAQVYVCRVFKCTRMQSRLRPQCIHVCTYQNQGMKTNVCERRAFVCACMKKQA